MYRGMFPGRRYRPPMRKVQAPKKKNPKLEQAKGRVLVLAGKKRALERSLKPHMKPIQTFEKDRWDKGEAIKKALGNPQAIEVAKKMKGRVSYEKFAEAKREVEIIKSAIHETFIEEEKEKFNIEMLTPPPEAVKLKDVFVGLAVVVLGIMFLLQAIFK